MKRFTYLVMLCVLPGCGGCGMGLKKFDPETVRQVEKTLAFEGADFEMTLEALVDGVSLEEKASLVSRHESEMVRLKAWLDAEQAKDMEAKKP